MCCYKMVLGFSGVSRGSWIRVGLRGRARALGQPETTTVSATKEPLSLAEIFRSLLV